MKEKSPKVEQLTIFVEATSPAEAERLALIEAKRQKPSAGFYSLSVTQEGDDRYCVVAMCMRSHTFGAR